MKDEEEVYWVEKISDTILAWSVIAIGMGAIASVTALQHYILFC